MYSYSVQNKPVPDIISKDLDILFCGINPGLTSAVTHHHFAKPGNRFWKALFLSQLVPSQLLPNQQKELLQYRIGITNFVTRPSATAKEISKQEYIIGSKKLIKKIAEFKPKNLVILGIEAFKNGFNQKVVTIGLQTEKIHNTQVWVFPNPSGLNAHYSLEDFVKLFAKLKQAV